MKKINSLLLLLFVLIGIQACNHVSSKPSIRIMSFNLLAQGGNASYAGFYPKDYQGSRYDDLARIIKEVGADIVGAQEDTPGDSLLLALGAGWHHCYNVYSKYEMKPIKSVHPMVNLCRVYLPEGDSLVLLNTHWWPVGGHLALARKIRNEGYVPKESDWKALEKEIVALTEPTAEGPRGYNASVNLILPYLASGEKVIVLGDFNEGSHLDWTERYSREGRDRFTTNPYGVPFKFPIRWPGSARFEQIGLKDSYREVYPDEVAHPGFTWTPPYDFKGPGRCLYSNQILERLDRIYFNPEGMECIGSGVVTGREGGGDFMIDCLWPSDHWALYSDFVLRSE